MSLGENIKKRRKELDLSVDDLAKAINKNRATVYRYENGDIESLPIDILVPLSQALRVSPADLMYGFDSDSTFNREKAIQAIPDTTLDRLSKLSYPDLLCCDALIDLYSGDPGFNDMMDAYFQMTQDERYDVYAFIENIKLKHYLDNDVLDVKRQIRSLNIDDLKIIIGYAQAILDTKLDSSAK